MIDTMERNKKFRIVFFGTPDFAVPTFQALINDPRYEIVGCVTQPDKPVGRKQILTPSPVKITAEQYNIPVFQPKTLKLTKEEGKLFFKHLQQLQPDIAVLIAYGKILPKELLQVPPKGFVNLHLSLLPLLRGASPIQQAIIQGHTETGITLMQMDEGMDTGDCIAAERMPITSTDTTETLNAHIAQLGAKVIQTYLWEYIQGNITPQPQDHANATFTKLIDKTDGEIDWKQPPEYIDRLIRAFTPWPGTYTYCGEKRVKILKAHVNAEGTLEIDLVQPEGKKPMAYSDFLQGNPDCTFIERIPR